jgi:predicted dehydrogenase
MGITLGICGVGAFADHFIPLFKAHPEVKQLVLCDLDAAKLQQKAELFGISATCPSLDELCQTSVDAIAIFTQNTYHGPQAVQALRAGKHVYSAVPSAVSLAETSALIETVQDTGKIYMLGETSYYYPCAIYCRERYRAGDFGHIVYSEGEYYHDFSHGLYDVYRWRYGSEWERYAGVPPFYYPTHSTSMIVSVTGAHVTHVCGMGFVDRAGDGLFGKGANIWDNPFANEAMLCKLSDGSIARINEFRRIGHQGAVRLSMYGTEGSYEEQSRSKVWVTKTASLDVTEQLTCPEVPGHPADVLMAKVTASDGTHLGSSKIHPIHLLPKEFQGLPNLHEGSHQFLVHDFVMACVSGQLPPNNVWQAARYLVPGLVAHESALAGGQLMEVPDFGDASCSGHTIRS